MNTTAKLPTTWTEYAIALKKCYLQKAASGWLLFTEAGPVTVTGIEEARCVAARTGCTVIL